MLTRRASEKVRCLKEKIELAGATDLDRYAKAACIPADCHARLSPPLDNLATSMAYRTPIISLALHKGETATLQIDLKIG